MHRRIPGHREALIAGARFPSDTTCLLADEIVPRAAVRAAELWSNLHDE